MDGFPKWARRVIFARDKATCQGCFKKWDDGWMLECDHIVPNGNGGCNDPDNGQLLCIECHADKHERVSRQFRKQGNIKSANAHAYWSRQIRKRNPRRYNHLQ